MLSMMENQTIRDSVDLTVEKFLFSRVRKYFCVRPAVSRILKWILQIVDNCPDNLRKVSSSLSAISLELDGFWGKLARGSCSTYINTSNATQRRHTLSSKSTIFSAKVLISLEKQNEYSPVSEAVKTKSPCRSRVPSNITLSDGVCLTS
jgi:hypothetical protein